jgi:putative tryptophan/tyrosine transport system permease protein
MVETILIITEQALLHFPLILGAYISVSLMKVPDLSIESAYVFGALCASTVLPCVHHLPSLISLPIIICASLIGGACVGLTSGLLTQKARIPHLLSSIITIGIFHGVSQLIAGVYISLSGYANTLTVDMIPLHPELPLLGIIFILGTLLTISFFKTELGYSLAVYGNNPNFFANYGISSAYIFMTGILIANALAGLSGYLFAQSNGFADINMGFGKLLLCVTALILGKSIHNKTLSCITPIAGLFGYFTLQQLLLKVGFDLRYFTAVQALVIVAILISQYKKNESLNTDHLGV